MQKVKIGNIYTNRGVYDIFVLGVSIYKITHIQIATFREKDIYKFVVTVSKRLSMFIKKCVFFKRNLQSVSVAIHKQVQIYSFHTSITGKLNLRKRSK